MTPRNPIKTGTLYCQTLTMGLFWHPHPIQHARDHFESNRTEWDLIGYPGWWADLESKAQYEALRLHMGDLFPSWPGESALVEDAQC